MKRICWSIFFLTFVVMGGALASPGRFAYVLRFSGANAYIDKFDADTDQITDEVALPHDSGYNNFVVDERGGCYIAEYRNSWDYGRNIYYYDPDSKKIELYLNLGDCFGPRYMVWTKDELIVEVRGNTNTRSKSGILFIDRKTKAITKIFLQEDITEPVQANINDIFYDGHSHLFLTLFYVRRVGAVGEGDVYVINTEKKQIEKIIKVPSEYKTVDGVYYTDNKVYVAALEKGEQNELGIIPSNNELLVFSYDKGELIKKIKVSDNPWKLLCDPSVGKLYVEHLNATKAEDQVEIISTKTDKVTGRLQIPSQLMCVIVKPGKMYFTVGGSMFTSSRTSPGMLVINTKTDKVIKRFYGGYKGISEKSFVQ